MAHEPLGARHCSGSCLLCHGAAALSSAQSWKHSSGRSWAGAAAAAVSGGAGAAPPPLVHGAIGSEAAELTVPAGHSLWGWWAFALAWPVHLLGFPPSSSTTHAAGVASRTEWKGWDPATAGARGSIPQAAAAENWPQRAERPVEWGLLCAAPHAALAHGSQSSPWSAARSDSRAEGVCCLQNLAWPLALSFHLHSLLH